MDGVRKERGPLSRCHIWGQCLLQAGRPGAGRRRWAQGLRAGRGGARLPATCGLRSGRQSVRSSDDCAAPPGPQRRGRSLLPPPPPPGPALSEHARAGVCQWEPAPRAVGSALCRPWRSVNPGEGLVQWPETGQALALALDLGDGSKWLEGKGPGGKIMMPPGPAPGFLSIGVSEITWDGLAWC